MKMFIIKQTESESELDREGLIADFGVSSAVLLKTNEAFKGSEENKSTE